LVNNISGDPCEIETGRNEIELDTARTEQKLPLSVPRNPICTNHGYTLSVPQITFPQLDALPSTGDSLVFPVFVLSPLHLCQVPKRSILMVAKKLKGIKYWCVAPVINIFYKPDYLNQSASPRGRVGREIVSVVIG